MHVVAVAAAVVAAAVVAVVAAVAAAAVFDGLCLRRLVCFEFEFVEFESMDEDRRALAAVVEALDSAIEPEQAAAGTRSSVA